MLQVDDHPLLDLQAVIAELPRPLGRTAEWYRELLSRAGAVTREAR